MWPLYESDGEQDGGTDKTRWGQRPVRECFEEFRKNWTRVHADSVQGLTAAKQLKNDGEIAEVLMRRLREAAAERAHNLLEHVCAVPSELPSVWDSVSRTLPLQSTIADDGATDEAEKKEGHGLDSSGAWLTAVDDAIEVDRADRARMDRAFRQLSTVHIAKPLDLLRHQPEVPVVQPIPLSLLRKTNVPCEDDVSPAVETRGNDKPMLGLVLQKIDSPVLVHVNPRWSSIRDRARTIRDGLVEIKCEAMQDLTVFAESKKPQRGDMTVDVDSVRCTASENVEKSVNPPPRFVQVDVVFRRPKPRIPVQDLASVMLRKVVKNNISAIIVPPVPSSFREDFSVFLHRAKPAQLFVERDCESGLPGLNVVALPIQVVRGDEKRVDDALDPFVEMAWKISKKYSASHISLTSLTLTLPSIWKMQSVQSMVMEDKTRRFVVSVDKMRGTNTNDFDQKNQNRSMEKSCSQKLLPAATQDPEPCQFREEEKPAAYSASCVVTARKLISFDIADAGNITTDDLVTSFLAFDDELHPGPQSDTMVVTESSTDSNPSRIDKKTSTLIDHLARPSVWYLIRAKLIRVESTQIVHILKTISLEAIEATIKQLHTTLQSFVSNPSGAAKNDLIDLCSSFRHAVWLHVLRIIIEDFTDSFEMRLLVTSRLVGSYPYNKALGKIHAAALSRLYVSLGGSSLSNQIEVEEKDHRRKKPRIVAVPMEKTPIKVLCSVRLLDQLDLLEQLSDQHVSVIERDLPSPIDIVVDEHNVISILTKEALEEENVMKTLTYELASAQLQFTKLWIIADPDCCEAFLHAFYAALASFRVEFQTFIGGANEFVAQLVRGVLDTCSDVALSERRVLPKMWFSRPFMLEEESQLERFLWSTRLMSPFAAQSLLHRVSLVDLTLKSIEELSTLVQGSVSGHQLQLLWRMLHIRHGIENTR